MYCLRFALLTVGFVTLTAQSSAQNSAPKKYTDEEKTGVDHNNIKLENLVIPVVSFRHTPFSEALDQIRSLAEKNDKDIEPGINIFLKHSPTSQGRLKEVTITLDLQDAPLRKVLEALAKQADLGLEVEPWAISLRATH